MISIVVPLYNEMDNIDELFLKVKTVMEEGDLSFELICINDGSMDDTTEKLAALSDNDDRVKVIEFNRNYGQTAAMMAGFNYSSGDIIVPMDGDLQNDPQDIPRLIKKINQGFDVCSGWRKERKDNKLKRTLPSKIANRIISLFSGVKLHDYGCSLKAYKKEVIKDVRLYGEMHRFIPIYASWHGAKICEIPVNHHPRTSGKSNYGHRKNTESDLGSCRCFVFKYHIE